MIRNTDNRSPLIVILGPTASGKTDLAAELAKEFNGEIINADSRQIYREIDIASAKPKFQNTSSRYGQALRLPIQGRRQAPPLQFHDIPHHLFDMVKPNEEFNVTHFKNLAIKKINDIHKRNKLPFLVGGTGLWISAVVDNLQFPYVPPNLHLRTELETDKPTRSVTLSEVEGSPTHVGSHTRGMLRQAQHDISTDKLYHDLIAKDPNAALFVNPHNRRRIIRALEVIEATGKPFSAQRKKDPPLFRILELGLMRPIQELEERIAKRVEEQMKEGLEEEARALFKQYDPKLPALSSISVREWRDYFAGTHTLEETLTLIRLHNRQYAKRQMTWFKRDARIQWIKNKEEAVNLIHDFLQLASQT